MAEVDDAPSELDTKTCGTCGREKLLKEFPPRKSSPDGRRGSCRLCVNAYKKDWETRNRGGTVESVDGEGDVPDSLTDNEAEFSVFGDLAQYGTLDERLSASAMLQHGTIEAAAESLGLTPEQLRNRLGELHRRAARQGFSPGRDDVSHPAPPGYHVFGITSNIDADGNIKQRWVKTRQDRDNPLAMIMDAVAGIADPFRGKSELVEPPGNPDDDLLCIYSMGDPHLGMHSWFEETGANFDLSIAEANLCAAVDELVARAPASKRALLIELGDFFHADNSAGTTTAGTRVDVDTRWAKVLRVGIRAMRRCIDKMLAKHEQVDAIIEIGNHDSHAAVMLALCLAQYYENNPRVNIDTSPAKFHWYRFGKNLIGVTHGDTAKFKDLPSIMACDRAQDWGETTYRYWYCGHVHHDSVKEFPGVTVETFRTLAPADAWHRASGYRSGQDMKLDVVHRDRGRIRREIIGIREVLDRVVACRPEAE